MVRTWILSCCLLLGTQLFAQANRKDTIAITLPEAEQIFLQKNLLLLAQRYQVAAIKANEIQAGLYNNPTVSAELALKAQNKPWFDIGSTGQKAFSLDQMIILAGKRNKRVQLANEDTRQAEFQLYDLLRTLKYELRSNFYSQVYATRLLEQLNQQRSLLSRIIGAYETQTEKRNIAAKDLVRLKTELIQLNNLRNDVLNAIITSQQAINLLLDTPAFVKPIVQFDTLQSPFTLPANLLEQALANRADLRMQESMVNQAQLNYSYQKALKTPDLQVGAGYDQNGSYAPKYFSLHAAIDMPFFNRNQGGISQAEQKIKLAQTGLAFKQSSIQNELATALNRLTVLESEFHSNQENFARDYPDINRGMIENFNKGNISILEFLDFFESYNAALQAISQIQQQRTLAIEELEYVVGAPIKK